MLKLVKKFNFTLVIWVVFYFLIFGILLKNSFSYLDPDLGWHLKVGEEISLTGDVPYLNNYNYTFNGNWVDHEWLINLVSFKIYDSFGYLTLSIIFAVLIILSLVLLNVIIRKVFKKVPDILIALLQLFGVLASLPHFGVRMQEFSFLFFILELWIIENFCNRKSFKILLWLLPLFYLWANIHGSFLFGLVVLIIWTIFKFFEKYLFKTKLNKYFNDEQLLDNKNLKIFSAFALLTIAITLLTPYGLDLYSFLGGYSNTFYLKAIQEWLPQSAFPFNYTQLFYLASSGAIILIYFYSSGNVSFKKLSLWHFFLLIIMLILAFKSRRNFPLMYVVSFLVLPQMLYSMLDLERIKTICLRTELKYFLVLVMFLTSLSNLLSFNPQSNPFSSFCKTYPCGATKFLKENSQYNNLNIFNEYNWGGYFIWNYPDKKLFIDGRLPQVNYQGHTFMEEYAEFSQANSRYADKLNEYDIRLAVLKSTDYSIKAKKWEKFIFWLRDEDLNYPHYLRYYLEGSEEWQKIYNDQTASVYLKIK